MLGASVDLSIDHLRSKEETVLLNLNRYRSTPKELVILGRENKKQLEDRIEDRITKMESERKSPRYVKGVHKSVKSWPVHNGVDRSQT